VNVIDVNDIDVCAKGPRYQLQLLVLILYFSDQVSALLIHRLQQVLQEFLFVVDPCCLVLDVTDRVTFRITNYKDVLDTFLFLQLMKWIGIVVTNVLENKRLFAKYFLFIVPVIDNLD
jgi:hypothetical protein